jgi:hypothetical protein
MKYTNTLDEKIKFKIKIFEPLSNRNWLEEKVNLWLSENKVTVQQINMTFTDDMYILTILYSEKEFSA